MNYHSCDFYFWASRSPCCDLKASTQLFCLYISLDGAQKIPNERAGHQDVMAVFINRGKKLTAYVFDEGAPS